MEETLKLILNELRELKAGQQELNNKYMDLNDRHLDLNQGQQELKQDVSSIKDNLINELRPYFEHIEKQIDAWTDELKDTLEDQQRVIDILAARSIKHESEINYIKRMLKNL